MSSEVSEYKPMPWSPWRPPPSHPPTPSPRRPWPAPARRSPGRKGRRHRTPSLTSRTLSSSYSCVNVVRRRPRPPRKNVPTAECERHCQLLQPESREPSDTIWVVNVNSSEAGTSARAALHVHDLRDARLRRWREGLRIGAICIFGKMARRRASRWRVRSQPARS